MKYWLFVIILILGSFLLGTIDRYHKAEKKWEIAMANVKAYDELLGKANDRNVAYQLTIDQLNSYQDSILRELNVTKKELDIKDKNIKTVQYIHSVYTKTDTITLRDTLFREPALSVDTIIGDEWYNVELGLRYPSFISISPSFKSEKHIFVHTKKETVNPPKKFFLFRWFQKKHKVLKVDVVEKNPYILEGDSRYIEIIK